jgi:hypothetical protein
MNMARFFFLVGILCYTPFTTPRSRWCVYEECWCLNNSLWPPSYPWSMLCCMLFDDYTSVPSWQACRDRHIMLTAILDLHLYLGLTVTVLNLIRGPTSLS